MFFGKSEPKRSPSFGMVLVVGALAVIGAATVAERGKAIITRACNKIKSLGENKDCECGIITKD